MRCPDHQGVLISRGVLITGMAVALSSLIRGLPLYALTIEVSLKGHLSEDRHTLLQTVHLLQRTSKLMVGGRQTVTGEVVADSTYLIKVGESLLSLWYGETVIRKGDYQNGWNVTWYVHTC